MAEPSKVIHFRNVPSDVAEEDFHTLLSSFGTIDKLVLVRHANQALVQMSSIEMAINLVQQYINVPAAIRGRNVFMQFSSHKEISKPTPQETIPNRILMIAITSPTYPMTVDVLHRVFSPHGIVEKIVTFQKNSGLQALVQFDSELSASAAMLALQGRYIYDGCCKLEIRYSTQSEVTISSNSDKARDFTVNIPNEVLMAQSQLQAPLFQQRPIMTHPHLPQLTAAASSALPFFEGSFPVGITGTNDRCTLIVSNLNINDTTPERIFNLFSNYGFVQRVKILSTKRDHAFVQYADGFQAELAVYYLRGATLLGQKLEVGYSKYSQVTPTQDVSDFTSSRLNKFLGNAKNYRYCCAPTRMLHCSNLSELATVEEVVEFMAPYGVAVKGKFIEKDGKKQILMMCKSIEDATDILSCVHGTNLNGATVRVAFSKHQAF